MSKDELVFAGVGNAFGIRGNVAVQVRTAALTLEALAAMATHVRLWKSRRTTRTGLLIVIGADAPAASEDVAKEQSRVIEQVLSVPDIVAVLVLEGSSLANAAKRAFFRLRFRKLKMQMVATVTDAVLLLTQRMEIPEEHDGLIRFVEELRRVTG